MAQTFLKVKVVPNASRSEVVGWLGDALKVKVQAPPEKGKANSAVQHLLAKTLDLAPSAIQLHQGATQPQKTFRITGLTPDALLQRLP